MNDASRWTTKIQGARSDAEVARIVRDYLASWAPAEIAAIATGVRPDGLRDRVEICEAAVEVARAELSFAGDPQAHRRLRELVAVLIAASNRFGQLEGPLRDGI